MSLTRHIDWGMDHILGSLVHSLLASMSRGRGQRGEPWQREINVPLSASVYGMVAVSNLAVLHGVQILDRSE